ATENLPGFHIYAVRTSDGYAAARLLVPRLWQAAAKRVQGQLVAVAVSRDTLLFTGAANPRAVGAMMYAAKDLATNEQYPITLVAVEWTGEGWRAAKSRMRAEQIGEE